MGQPRGPVYPQQQAIDVFPRLSWRDCLKFRKVLREKLPPALLAESPVRCSELLFSQAALRAFAWEVSTRRTASAMARAKRGGTAFPACRYLECAAPPSIRPGNAPLLGSVTNTNRSGKLCSRANSRTLR